jgi:ubiquinone/menaquinone biosynthesis C-methylase UbiE
MKIIRIKEVRMKSIIDVCCGSKMFWYNRNHPEAVYMDIRQLEDTLCDGRKLIVKPDIVGDFKDIPYPDNTFKLAVFDPPHLINGGDKSWLVKKWVRGIRCGIDLKQVN